MGESTTPTLAPVVKKVVVPLSGVDAFQLFTAKIATWWPLDTGHSISGDHAVGCTIEGHVGGRVYESDDEGGEHIWGTVIAWDPPRSLSFTWHPGRDESTAQQIEVRFEDLGEETAVVLEHTGWEVLAERAEAIRASYETGWAFTLGRFQSQATK